MSDIDEYILDQAIRESGASFKENSQSFIFDCPRCGKADKLYIRKRDGRFTCWVCSETESFHGSAEYALTEILSIPVAELRPLLGISNYQPKATEKMLFQLRDHFGEQEAAADDRVTVEFDSEFIDIADPKAREGQVYLAGRGVSLDVAVAYRMKFNPRNGRLVIPVYENGKLYGWQARATRATEWRDLATGEERKVPKILTLKTMNKGRHLMFYDNLVGSQHAILCEGPFDALKCHKAGGAVATMGKIVSDEQVALIQDSGVQKVYLALDPDAEDEIGPLAQRFSGVQLFKLLPGPGYKDLGEMDMDDVVERFRTAPRIRPGTFEVDRFRRG